jgi:hypothetical protein
MALPDTITLNVGSPAADRVYTREQSNGNAAQYTAPSPNNDLAGRSSLVIEHKTVSGDLVSSKVQFKRPIQDASGEYSTYLQGTVVLIRPAMADLDDVDELLEEIQEVFAASTVRADIGGAKY